MRHYGGMLMQICGGVVVTWSCANFDYFLVVL